MTGMKVTALIPDELIKDVKQLSGAKNITEALIFALNEWTALQKLKSLQAKVAQKPLRFQDGFGAERIRKINRHCHSGTVYSGPNLDLR